MYTSPVDWTDSDSVPVEIQDVVIWEVFDEASTPLPNGLSLNTTLGRFELLTDIYFQTGDNRAFEWDGTLFLQIADGSDGYYNVDVNVEDFNYS